MSNRVSPPVRTGDHNDPLTRRTGNDLRPQLSVSTGTAFASATGKPELDLFPPHLTSSSTDTIKPGHSRRWETATQSPKGSSDVTSNPRGSSHGRSYSMNEHQYRTDRDRTTLVGTDVAAGYPASNMSDSFSSAGSTMGDSVVSAATTVSGAQLARRNNTVGASNSRLVRLERNRARIALQGAGLSEEDQEFYVPPSPARSGPYANVPWSDIGHGSGLDDDQAYTSLVSPAASTFDQYSRSSYNNHSDVVAAAAWARAGATPPQPAPHSDTYNDSMQHRAQQQQVNMPEPKRSSFVVLRGGKGDQKLTERRAANTMSPPPPNGSDSGNTLDTQHDQTQAIDIAVTGGTSQLRHKNSLKPFLDQEQEERELGGRAEEDWERGLMDERKSGAEGGAEGDIDSQHAWLQSDPYATLKTPPLSASFPSQLSSPFGASSHSRSSTFHAPSRTHTDPWSTTSPSGGNISAFEEDAALRRHQSLSSFQSRSRTSSQVLSTSPGSSFGPFANDNQSQLERAQSLTTAPTQPIGSLALNSTPGIAGFGSRSRSGTSPAPLTLHHSQSLGHASASQRAGLSHSNSLGSKKSSTSLSGNSHAGGSLSPSLGVALGGLKSPWSPTEAETKQLGLGQIPGTSGGSISPNGSGSLSRGGSGSSRSSQPVISNGGIPNEESTNRLGEQLGAMHLEKVSPSPGLSPHQQQQSFALASGSSGAGLPPHQQTGSARRLAPLVTNPEALSPNTQHAYLPRQGPASASAFVPPIGHSHQPFSRGGGMSDISERPATLNEVDESGFAQPTLAHTHGSQLLLPHQVYGAAMLSQPPNAAADPASSFPPPLYPQHASAFPGGSTAADWSRQKDMLLGGGGPGSISASTIVPAGALPFSTSINPTLPPQHTVAPAEWNLMQQQQAQISLLQSQMAQALKAMDAIKAQTGQQNLTNHMRQVSIPSADQDEVAETPVDVNGLVQKKGYNPTVFDLRPQNARFFVIKSYTEEDVHKSLKYEIWASTDLGNKRLDKAFRESADKGPIYLFFSVNASGHFAGMAQMLTPVDYSLTSNVWASDKWKGVLKVRWIYIKDVPLNALRHIRLNNTPENKPVTSSRDTQEVPYDAGLEVLRIIATYQSRASLLQDFAWYEAQHRHDKSSDDAGTTTDAVVPPRQAHYARNDRNQQNHATSSSSTPASVQNSNGVAAATSATSSGYASQAPPQAYPQFVPPTPPYQQHPARGFSPSPQQQQQQQQQQQRQPFRSFWQRGNASQPPPSGHRPPSAGSGSSHSQRGPYDGQGVAF
ncbi:mRNA-binding phosphate metabolism regulator [Sporobolomyces koalae]|uniref:mRNA-binding phosphate metabolism regulator n=1 Tax=Sporobolomyces koalae TaxID=500713 RepID=UPI00317BB4A8